MLMVNGLNAFPIKSNPVFNNGPKSLPQNPLDCTILCDWVFEPRNYLWKLYEASKPVY